MDLHTMELKLRRMVGRPTEGDVPRADLYEHINSAYLDICDRFQFGETRTRIRFSAGTHANIYELPQEIAVLMGVSYFDQDGKSYKLTKIPSSVAGNKSFDSEKTGRPQEYAIHANSIQIYPFLDQDYTIELYCRVTPNKLVQPFDQPIIPLAWHQGILLLARWFYYDEITDLPKAKYSLEMFSSWVSTKPSEFAQELIDNDQAMEVPTAGGVRFNTRQAVTHEQFRTGPI